VPPDGAYLRTFFRAIYAILPGNIEATMQRFRDPDSIRAIVEPHTRRYKSERFNTLENNNFNCLLKELITHHDFLVDQHNYALESTLVSLLEPEGAIWDEQFYPFQSASYFDKTRCDALRRLDTLFETRKEEVHDFMKGDAARDEIWRLESIRQKLNQDPEVVTRSYTFVHELPPPKLHFPEMETETRYVEDNFLCPRTSLKPSRRAFLREHWPEFQLATYWNFRNVFDIKETFRNPVMNRFGQEFFVRQAESAWSNYLFHQIDVRTATGRKNIEAFRDDMINFPREYNALVEGDPKLGSKYCVKDIGLLVVPPDSILDKSLADRWQ
jgi:hypothetical protein